MREIASVNLVQLEVKKWLESPKEKQVDDEHETKILCLIYYLSVQFFFSICFGAVWEERGERK